MTTRFNSRGGCRSGALIGMGIANNPDLLIADEPTTALDVTIAAQILKLMKEIQEETNASIILITHDLAAVAQICTRVLVMYAGRIVESASIKTFYRKPAHLVKQVSIIACKPFGHRVLHENWTFIETGFRVVRSRVDRLRD